MDTVADADTQFAIQAVLNRYARACDERDWQAFVRRRQDEYTRITEQRGQIVAALETGDLYRVISLGSLDN